jgi:hypothetical protein
MYMCDADAGGPALVSPRSARPNIRAAYLVLGILPNSLYHGRSTPPVDPPS